jgi:hypothetical protein
MSDMFCRNCSSPEHCSCPRNVHKQSPCFTQWNIKSSQRNTPWRRLLHRMPLIKMCFISWESVVAWNISFHGCSVMKDRYKLYSEHSDCLEKFYTGKVNEMGSIFFLAMCYFKLYAELWIFLRSFAVERSVQYIVYFSWQWVCSTGAVPRCLKTLKEYSFARTCFCTCQLKTLHIASNTPTVSPWSGWT